MVNFPHNPTGLILEESNLDAIENIVQKKPASYCFPMKSTNTSFLTANLSLVWLPAPPWQNTRSSFHPLVRLTTQPVGKLVIAVRQKN